MALPKSPTAGSIFSRKCTSRKKTTPATVEFVDTPGLIRGEKADNPQRIATLRNADGLLIVLDGFSKAQPPAEQLQAFREELLFADLEVVTNRIEKLEAGTKKPKPEKIREQEQREIAELKELAARLENNQPLDEVTVSDETAKTMRSFQLFSKKPEFVVLNCREDQVGQPSDEALARLTSHVIVTAAKLELDLVELDEAERAVFMEEMRVRELARNRIIREAYDVVRLISFFTVGEDECKAWTIQKERRPSRQPERSIPTSPAASSVPRSSRTMISTDLAL